MLQPVPSPKHVARILKALRIILGLKVSDIAGYSGKSMKTIHRWEKGESVMMNESWVNLVRSIEQKHGLTEEDLRSEDIEKKIEEVRRRSITEMTDHRQMYPGFMKSQIDQFSYLNAGFLFPHDFSNPLLKHILLKDNDPRIFTNQEPPYEMEEEHLMHLLGTYPVSPIPTKGLRRFILEPVLTQSIGLRKIEVQMLIEMNLPEWCSTPQIFTEIIMAYREAIRTGQLKEKQ